MSNRSEKGRALFLAALMVISVVGMTVAFSGAAVADDATANIDNIASANNPAGIPGNNADASQQVFADADADTLSINSLSEGDVQHAVTIDISDLEDAGVDLSNAQVDLGNSQADHDEAITTASIAYSNVEGSQVQLVIDTSGGTSGNDGGGVDIKLALSGLDTSNVATASDLEYVVRVDDTNSGDFGSGFTTDVIGTTETFNIATIEVENLATGEQTTTTTMSAAITEANDPSAGEFTGSAGDQVEIRPLDGTYTFDTGGVPSITDDNTRIVPANGGDVTFENNNAGTTLDVQAGISGVEIINITFDQATNAEAAVTINNNADDVAINDSSFTNVVDTDGQPVIALSDGAAAVTIDNNDFTGDGVAATAIDGSASDDGGDQLDLTVTNNNITGFDDPDDNLGEGIILANDISAATIENNIFDSNDQHVDDEAGVTTLNDVFANNNFSNQYVTIESSSGDIQDAIYGDLATADTNTPLDGAADRTVTVAGTHTVGTVIDLSAANDGTTITGASSGATIVSDNDPVFSLTASQASNVEFSGLTFDLSGGPHTAITDSSNNYDGLTITNNEFTGANGDAVVVELTSGTYAAGLTVSSNTFDSDNNYQAINLVGATLSGTDAFEVNENSINDADGTDAIALGTLGNANIGLQVQNNEITNQTDNDAISVDPDTADQVTISANTLTGESDGAGTGISILDAGSDADGSVVTISNNDISNFDDEAGSGTGVLVTPADVTIENNVLSDNAQHFDDAGDNYDEQTVIDDNTVSPVVLALDQRGGDIQDNAVYGTVEGGVEGAEAANANRFLDVGPGTYEENSITIDALGGSLNIDGSDEATLTTDTANQILAINVPGGAVTVGNVTFAAGEDNANPDIDISDTSANPVTIEDSVFESPGNDSRQGILVDEVSNPVTVTISNNEFSNYAEAVQYDDGSVADVTLDVVRNGFSSNTIAVDLASSDGGGSNNDVFRIHFNDIVGNGDGIDNDLTPGDLDGGSVSARANWWGDSSGPSGEFSGDGDTVTGGNSGDVIVEPWLTDTVDTLPTDRYVVITDPVAPVADDAQNPDVVVAVLDDGLAGDTDADSTSLLADPSGPISGAGTADRGTVASGGSAADPLLYTGITSDTAGDYTLTAQDANGDVPKGSGVQQFVGGPDHVNIEVDSDELVANDEDTINATLTLVDSEGSPVDTGGTYTVSWLIDNGSNAGVTRVTEEDLNTNTPNTEARLEISATNEGYEVGITGVYDDDGFSNSTSVTTVLAPMSVTATPSTVTVDNETDVVINVTDQNDQGIDSTSVDLSGAGVSQTVLTNSTGIATATVNASSSGTIGVNATADGYENASTDVEVVAPGTVPTDPEERALQIAGQNDPANLTQDNVTTVITHFDRDDTVNNIEVTQDDVTATITLFERN